MGMSEEGRIILSKTLVALEQEEGLQELANMLALTLLACSARLVGDEVRSQWVIESDHVDGTIIAVTAAGLEVDLLLKKAVEAPLKTFVNVDHNCEVH